MTKLKQPLLSLEAHGTLGSSLTYTGKANRSRVGAVPTHPDAQSPAQLANRFMYSLGLAQWQGFTPSQKAVYASLAIGRNYTAMNAWMNTWLTTTPNLLLALPVVLGQGHTLPDLSPNATDMTLTGPTWTQSSLSTTITADGLDDYAHLPSVNDLLLDTDTFTFFFQARRLSAPGDRYFFTKGDLATNNWRIETSGGGLCIFRTYVGGVSKRSFTSGNAWQVDTWHNFALRFSLPDADWYIDGTWNTPTKDNHPQPVAPLNQPTLFARSSDLALNMNLELAFIVVFDRALSPAELQALHQRFPLPTT